MKNKDTQKLEAGGDRSLPSCYVFSDKGRDFPTKMQALAYESHGSWWVGLIPGDSKIGELVGKYLAWKIKRRFNRIQKSIEFERRTRITNPDWWENFPT